LNIVLAVEILEILSNLGWRDDEELSKIRSTSATIEKPLSLILSNRVSFDNLPWPMDKGDSPELPELEETVMTRFDESATMHSLVEIAIWDPARLSLGSEERKNVHHLTDIHAPLEAVVGALQRWLIESRFEWFYSNSHLVLARHRARKIDLILNIGYGSDADLKVTVHVVADDPVELNRLVMSLTRVVNRLV
jgi:hypothetical protein